MILFHVTDKAGAQGIRTRGFGVSHLPDSVDCSWFNTDPELCRRTASHLGWLVVVEVPDHLAEPYRATFENGTLDIGDFCIPWGVVNRFRDSFRFEQVASA